MSEKITVELSADGALKVLRALMQGEAFWFVGVKPGNMYDFDMMLNHDGVDATHTRITLRPDGTWSMTAGIEVD
jgi:hypothetical protein